MDLHSVKYPGIALFHSDIKTYEQNAGQRISKKQTSCHHSLPLQSSWFWKSDFPTSLVKNPEELVKNDIIPLNNAYCNFILNVAPNPDGLIDQNALTALKQIGKLWHDDYHYETLPEQTPTIISPKLAKHKFTEASWSMDMNIMDFGNDDNFSTSCQSNLEVQHPWFEIDLGKEQHFNAIAITEGSKSSSINNYQLEYLSNGQWATLLTAHSDAKTKIHRFQPVWGSKIRMIIQNFDEAPSIAEFGVYNEQR